MSGSTKTSPVKKQSRQPGPADRPPGNDKSDAGTNSMNITKENNDGVEPDHSILSDPEDYLEENESLDMNLANGEQKVWLVKLPRYLAEKWSNTEELGGQQLGRVKIKQTPRAGSSGNKLQVKLVLNELAMNEDIPHEYDISMLNTQVRNSYVFSEENLTKFKQELTEVAEMPEQPSLQPVDKKKMQNKPYKFFRVQKNKEGQDGAPIKKYVPYVKTIPKKTALVGKICHDCQIVPAKSDSKYSQMSVKRQSIQPAKPRPKVTLLDEIPGVVQSNAGPSIKGNNTSVFLKSNPAKAKSGEGRAIRMPKKDLLDLLFRLFEEYEYWSMKGLKERTRQPESYLKESLDSIANLIKKGPYTSKYNLKPEYRRLRDAERAARLGLVVNDDQEEKEEDVDVEMEDVI